MKRLIVLTLMLAFCLGGCSLINKPTTIADATTPDQTATDDNATEPVAKTEKKQGADIAYKEEGKKQYLEVTLPREAGDAAYSSEPDTLKDLLEMKGHSGPEETAVSLMRPNAIREAAQLVTFQTAIAWRYGELVRQTDSYATIMDTAFNFSPLMLTHGDALIMPPVIARAGASMRIEEEKTATAARTTYELLEPAKYIAVTPNWREYLMMDSFPEPEKPNPAVLPKNSAERKIWREAVREAWAQGLAEADQLYADNVARMVRSYRGVMLYHLLTAQQLMSKVSIASANLGTHLSDKGNKLNIGQKVYRITRPSAFTLEQPKPAVKAKPAKKPAKKKPVRKMVNRKRGR